MTEGAHRIPPERTRGVQFATWGLECRIEKFINGSGNGGRSCLLVGWCDSVMSRQMSRGRAGLGWAVVCLEDCWLLALSNSLGRKDSWRSMKQDDALLLMW